MEIEEDYPDYVDQEFEDQEDEINEVWDNALFECIGRYMDRYQFIFCWEGSCETAAGLL